MPFLFLSPSTQDFNPYVTTGNEQYWMNRIARPAHAAHRALRLP